MNCKVGVLLGGQLNSPGSTDSVPGRNTRLHLQGCQEARKPDRAAFCHAVQRVQADRNLRRSMLSQLVVSRSISKF